MQHYTQKNVAFRSAGFTLMELIIVIIIMGVMAVGIAGFIKLSTQTYLNVTERDELLANARFSVERLNREIRNAVPNSMRETSSATTHCLEFVPTIASTIYTEIPVAPESAISMMKVIPFIDNEGNGYQCNNECGHLISVYPIRSDGKDIFDHSLAKVFAIDNYALPVSPETVATINLTAAVTFAEDSPTNRGYIFDSPVSYCLNGDRLTRYAGYDFNASQLLPPFFVNGSNSLMAENVDFASSRFTVQEASLQRNAVVQIKLNFTRDSEQVVFDNAIHINNIP